MAHDAQTWVETWFPDATEPAKASLILAYGAGLDAGLVEAQELLEAEAQRQAQLVRDAWKTLTR
jgi:hypothetical protein